MRIFTFMNQKGGVAKTTSALSLIYGLTKQGYKVLACDFDPQQNLSLSTGVNLNNFTSLYSVIRDEGDVREAINHCGDIDVLTLGLEGTGADLELNSRTSREFLLREQLKTVQKDYDFCIIDTPPHLGLLALNALTCTEGVIIPISAEDGYALQGFSQLLGLFKTIKKMTNKKLKLTGTLITRVKNTEVSKMMIPQIISESEKAGVPAFTATIRHSDRIPESVLMRENIYDFSKTSYGSRDYKKFTEEFLERIGE